MTKKKLTVYDLLQLKGKRQIHEVYVNNVEEAIAAEEAGKIIMSARAHWFEENENIEE